jgi:hypothetical protein
MALRISTFLFLPIAATLLLQAGWCKGTGVREKTSTTQTDVRNTQASSPSVATPQKGRALPPGAWGGLHISLEVTDTGAQINYDCAHGRISEKIVPDSDGAFEVKGFHTPEHPGPTREGEDNEQPAIYRGSIHEDTMTLAVRLSGHDEPVGTFELTRGSAGKIRKCM